MVNLFYSVKSIFNELFNPIFSGTIIPNNIIVTLVLICILLIIVKLKNEFKKLTRVIVYGLARHYRYIAMMSHRSI